MAVTNRIQPNPLPPKEYDAANAAHITPSETTTQIHKLPPGARRADEDGHESLSSVLHITMAHVLSMDIDGHGHTLTPCLQRAPVAHSIYLMYYVDTFQYINFTF